MMFLFKCTSLGATYFITDEEDLGSDLPALTSIDLYSLKWFTGEAFGLIIWF